MRDSIEPQFTQMLFSPTSSMELRRSAFNIMLSDPQQLIKEFRKVAAIAGIQMPKTAVTFERLGAPHKPSRLPNGKMAVYVFCFNGECLKVGKAGPKSHARFTNQHYSSRSSRSNLAKSLLACTDQHYVGLTEKTVGRWIKGNVERTDFLLDARYGIAVLTLLESFLQCKLEPKFEGFKSQQVHAPHKTR